VGRKDKGRKGDKGKGRKHHRAHDEASIDTRVAPVEGVPEVAAAPTVEAAPKRAAPKLTRPRVATLKAPARPAAAQPAAARPAAARSAAAPRAERPRVERLTLPTDRASLLALHQAARRQRDAAPLLSTERAEASFEIERIEVQIARVERAMDPPLV
jgi:hypothetical protein